MFHNFFSNTKISGVVGIYFYLLENKPDTAEHLGWIPLTALVIFIFSTAIGLAPVPWVMVGELIILLSVQKKI